MRDVKVQNYCELPNMGVVTKLKLSRLELIAIICEHSVLRNSEKNKFVNLVKVKKNLKRQFQLHFENPSLKF